MPLTALHTPSGKRLLATDFQDSSQIRKEFKRGELVCPFWKTELYGRGGISKYSALHFVHATECSTKMGYHPESVEHFAGKLALAEYLKAELSEQSDVEVIIEYPIPEAGEHGRIADVAAVFPSGWVLVYECQLAAITPELLEQRTKDYASVGADVLWFLGGKANSIPNITWCEEYFGNCFFIKLEKDSQNINLWSSESS